MCGLTGSQKAVDGLSFRRVGQHRSQFRLGRDDEGWIARDYGYSRDTQRTNSLRYFTAGIGSQAPNIKV